MWLLLVAEQEIASRHQTNVILLFWFKHVIVVSYLVQQKFFFRRLGRDKNSSVQKCNKVSISLFPIPFIRYEVFALRYFLRARVRVFGITILNTRIQKPAYSEFE